MATHITLRRATAKGKKYKMVFVDKDGRTRTTHFGQQGASDFTRHGDKDRRARYWARHRPREDWDDPHSAGSLSRYVLWNKRSLDASVRDYARRFGFQVK